MVKVLFCVFMASSTLCFSQGQEIQLAKKYKKTFYTYWGWNRDWYSNSNIQFNGKGYDFSLEKVVAHDKQNPVGLDPYLAPLSITVPQTNFRIGYFFSDHWSLSLGLDHMKYVVDQNQTVPITGAIHNSPKYEGVYDNTPIQLTEDFLQFEHTDGLNYINVEVRRLDNLLNLRRFKLPNIDLNITEGLGVGALLPKTNCVLLGNERADEFHLAGYGLSSFIGLNITFFEHFFIQSELKGGYINMPDIRTTHNPVDRADQHFFFSQVNFLVGANFKL